MHLEHNLQNTHAWDYLGVQGAVSQALEPVVEGVVRDTSRWVLDGLGL